MAPKVIQEVGLSEEGSADRANGDPGGEKQDRPLTAQEERNSDPGRMLTFTDGVFAIVITILVLELQVPDLDSSTSLGDALAEIRPTFVAFVASFLLVGMYWVWHRGTFAHVRYITNDVLWLNMLFLLPTSLVPFAASVLGKHPGSARALYLYGTVLIAITAMRFVLDWYLRAHPDLLWAHESRQAMRLRMLAAAAPMVVYGLALLVAIRLPGLSIALYFIMPLVYFLLIVALKADPRTRVAAKDLS
ncbi:MAG: hypothetical protein BMS9Abin07_1536 [Acidimicrobiia bacterium]|nr:MAG: hypothetical protein BMS9Abin07_1536 [Acidimicrobiia bacterium]